MSSDPLVRLCQAGRAFGVGARAVLALQPLDCEVQAGDRIAIVGPSGSGKSTLLHLMAGLDVPTTGTVSWPAIGDSSRLRPGPIGMVFQGPSLLPPLSVLENVALPLQLEGVGEDEAQARSYDALAQLALAELAAKLPEELSGGQAQRVAIARALVSSPVLILADEPTSQLDAANGERVVDLLLDAADRSGAALVVATHDLTIADRLDARWHVSDGMLRRESEIAAW